jgi:hypothetical protein
MMAIQEEPGGDSFLVAEGRHLVRNAFFEFADGVNDLPQFFKESLFRRRK